MKVNFIIDGKPQGKGRPRLSYGRIKTPEQTVIYENYIKLLYRSQVKAYFEGPIKIAINCFYPIAKSDSKKKKQAKLNGEIRPHNIKPDADNVIKVICDALNKVAYKDDTQIVELVASKHFADKPRVEVTIEALA